MKLGEENEKNVFGVDLFANEKKKEGRKETNCKENLKETEKGFRAKILVAVVTGLRKFQREEGRLWGELPPNSYSLYPLQNQVL